MELIISINDALLEDNSSNPELTSMFVCLSHNGKTYPESDWIDTPGVILNWWIYDTLALLSGAEGQGLSFMEGPFELESSLSEGKFRLIAKDFEIDWVINKDDYLNALIKGVNSCARIFRKMGHIEMADDMTAGIKSLRDQLA